MSGHKENIAEFAEIFVNLPPERQRELLERLGDANVVPAEWLSILAKHHMLKGR
jgi:hypothetical protein